MIASAGRVAGLLLRRRQYMRVGNDHRACAFVGENFREDAFL
jgi:hypothetical protein